VGGGKGEKNKKLKNFVNLSKCNKMGMGPTYSRGTFF